MRQAVRDVRALIDYEQRKAAQAESPPACQYESSGIVGTRKLGLAWTITRPAGIVYQPFLARQLLQSRGSALKTRYMFTAAPAL